MNGTMCRPNWVVLPRNMRYCGEAKQFTECYLSMQTKVNLHQYTAGHRSPCQTKVIYAFNSRRFLSFRDSHGIIRVRRPHAYPWKTISRESLGRRHHCRKWCSLLAPQSIDNNIAWGSHFMSMQVAVSLAVPMSWQNPWVCHNRFIGNHPRGEVATCNLSRFPKRR